MIILVSLPSSPPSPVSFSPPARARSVSSRSSCSSAADSSGSAWSRSSVTSVIWCLLRLGGYTVEITVPAAALLGLPADRDHHVLRVGDRDIRRLASVVVVREAVLHAVDRVLVPELRVVVRRSSLVEVRRVGLLRQ